MHIAYYHILVIIYVKYKKIKCPWNTFCLENKDLDVNANELFIIRCMARLRVIEMAYVRKHHCQVK